jgi:peptide/nickel transport system ATP-binding protein
MEFVSAGSAPARAVEDVSFDVYPGQTLGLVGESGCGKTTTMLSLMRLLPSSGRITSGEVLFDDIDLLRLSERQMRDYRWKQMAMIFQGAMNALNPVRTVGDQIAEAILLHGLMDRAAADRRVVGLLDLVGIAKSRKDQYPHQYSGGMRQRAMIAMALACQPKLLFADEPTTALDVMIQAQILELLRDIQQVMGLAIVLVTHDLGVVAELCDTVVVMYGGRVAEYGPIDVVYNAPQHPYTQRLLEAFPDLNRPADQLISIPGYPPRLNELPSGCRFEPRCHKKIEQCASVVPRLIDVTSESKPATGSWPLAAGKTASTNNQLLITNNHLAACHLLTGPEVND